MFKISFKKHPYDVCFSQETYRHVRTALDHAISALAVISEELPPNTSGDARAALRATRRLLIIAYFKMQRNRYAIPRDWPRAPETVAPDANEVSLLSNPDESTGHAID